MTKAILCGSFNNDYLTFLEERERYLRGECQDCGHRHANGPCRDTLRRAPRCDCEVMRRDGKQRVRE